MWGLASWPSPRAYSTGRDLSRQLLPGQHLWCYLTYGLLAGVGIGLGYIVPIATLIKWFPDKRGFITGVAVAGFGAGAVLTALIARALVTRMDVFTTFAILGILYLIMVVGAGFFMKNPPSGWTPEGWEPEEEESGERSGVDYELGGALKTWQWYALWAILFLNVTAGIASSPRPRRWRRRYPLSTRSSPPAWSASSQSPTAPDGSSGPGSRTPSAASGSF